MEEGKQCSNCFWWSDENTSVCTYDGDGMYGRHVMKDDYCPRYWKLLTLNDLVTDLMTEDNDDD